MCRPPSRRIHYFDNKIALAFKFNAVNIQNNLIPGGVLLLPAAVKWHDVKYTDVCYYNIHGGAFIVDLTYDITAHYVCGLLDLLPCFLLSSKEAINQK